MKIPEDLKEELVYMLKAFAVIAAFLTLFLATAGVFGWIAEPIMRRLYVP